ncbi:RES domain-containing protein [Priestia endophytica]|uniref:RES domain-containing protein n=1 Tax=Priestia endophytica TaxID=135735 RepID=UPI000DCA70F1|nr:RES domain-containing protein [Priestia endophytica]RAS75720.1 hypothetical protein A4R27_21975 [Priestia endophytica]
MLGELESDSVLCLWCANIREQMDYNSLTLYDLDSPPVSIVGFQETCTCKECKEELEPETPYILVEDYQELIEKLGEKLGEILSDHIEFCSHCLTEIEQTNWVYEKELGMNIDSGTDITDFISEYNVYSDERNNGDLLNSVIKNLICQNCGHGFPDRDGIGGYFNQLDKVYSQQDVDDFYGLDIDGLNISELNNIGDIYGVSFTKDELNDFISYIYTNSALSIKHKVGKKLYSLLESHFPNNDYVLKQGNILFRGRKRYYDQEEFSNNSLWSPPEGQASHGRYNSIGNSVLYCLDKYKGLPYELNPLKNECIDYGEFILNTDLKILDISKLFPKEFGDYISSVDLESKKLKKTYLFTNFISSCCKDIGYDGIRYKGVSDKEQYYNFAIFNVKPDNQLSIKKVKSIKTDVSYQLILDKGK